MVVEERVVSSPVVLGIDRVLGALIGPPGCVAEKFVACAGDVIDHARFAMPMASGSRAPNTAFAPPTDAEIEHRRDVVFGRERDE